MRVVTLMCLALAGLAGAVGSGAEVQARGQSAPPAAAAQPTAGAPAAQPAAAPPAATGRGGASAGIRAADKRRRSYASCNRESHNRNLRGGARRRFLIRCKLGYERRRPGQGSGQAAGQGAQPQAQPAGKASPPQQPQQAPAKPSQPPTQSQPPGKRP